MLRKLSHNWRSSFRFKLILVTVLTITLTVAVYSALLFWHHAHVSEADQKDRAGRLASLLAESLAPPLYEFNSQAVDAAAKALESHADIRRVQVIDGNGKRIVDQSNRDQSGEILLIVQRDIIYKTGKRALRVGQIELTFSRGSLDDELYRSLYDTVIGGLLMAISTVCAALWALRSLTRPLSDITRGLDQLAAGQTEVRLPALGRTDEFGRMITAMHRFRDAIVDRLNAEHAVRETETRHRQELEQTVAQRTAQLAVAKDAAESANRAKSSFVANMSHEIRTPLNAVLGLAKIIVREDLGRKSEEYAKRILEAGEHLLGVINDILDFSKIEAGKVLIDPQPFELTAGVTKAVDMVRDRAALKKLSLNTHMAPDLPVWVTGDPLRIEQILINLLSNAVKFTERGEVSLSVTREGEYILFRVTDTGIGMDANQVERLFRPFEQADGSTTRRFGGTGLGLAISRSLANQMGGDIVVESHHGRGSAFTVSLPLAEASAEVRVAAAVSQDGPRLKGLRILAADDVEFNRFVLEDLLVNEGAAVEFAENGQLALDLLARLGREAFDVVLTDIQMPVMDGYEVSRHITKAHPTLPVIGLTAHAMTEERNRCLAAGMVAHVTKPIDENLLIATILRCCTMPVVDTVPVELVVIKPTQEVSAEIRQWIDWDALMHRYRGRITFIDKLIETFLRTHAETPQKLRDAAQRGDSETMKFLAHNIKGIAGNLEAGTLLTIATDAYQSSEQQAPDMTSVLIVQLAGTLEVLLKILKQRSVQQQGEVAS